jgi:hypothetical protein
MNKLIIDTTQTVNRIRTYYVEAEDLSEAKLKLQKYIDSGIESKDIKFSTPEDEGGEETILE